MLKLIAIVLLLLLAKPIDSSAWGFYAHRKINNLAVYTLPPELFGFYKAHIKEITKRATAADERRGVMANEAPKHYIDADHYEHSCPLDTIPHNWEDALVLYTEDTVKSYGIVPWNIDFVLYSLTKAFQEKDIESIIKLSADLGHYVGDAHVPLHCTENYNGQLTGQKGIHALWESRLPELFDTAYDYFVGKAYFMESPSFFIWESITESFAAKDTVLRLEKELSDSFPESKKYTFVKKGATLKKDYSEEFSTVYHNALGNMVERRMQKSILTVGSLWYTAWVNAGSPELPFTLVKPTEEEKEEILPEHDHLERKR